MKIELKIKQGSLETQVTLDGYWIMVEALVEAIKKTVREKDNMAEIN